MSPLPRCPPLIIFHVCPSPASHLHNFERTSRRPLLFPTAEPFGPHLDRHALFSSSLFQFALAGPVLSFSRLVRVVVPVFVGSLTVPYNRILFSRGRVTLSFGPPFRYIGRKLGSPPPHACQEAVERALLDKPGSFFDAPHRVLDPFGDRMWIFFRCPSFLLIFVFPLCVFFFGGRFAKAPFRGLPSPL